MAWTLVFIAVFAIFAVLGVIGFYLNTSTPLQVGPLPFLCFMVAAVSLVVVITRIV